MRFTSCRQCGCTMIEQEDAGLCTPCRDGAPLLPLADERPVPPTWVLLAVMSLAAIVWAVWW